MHVKIFTVQILLGLLLVASSANADTMLVKDGSEYKAGLAIAWKQKDAGWLFTIKKGEDVTLIADQLKTLLTKATITITNDEHIFIVGIDKKDLFTMLSSSSIEMDPLAALGGLGQEGLAMAGPEAGGSIRASKPTALPPSVFPTTVFKTHHPDERFTAKVIQVNHEAFPTVVLTLLIKQKPLKGTCKLKKKKKYTATILFAGQKENIDYQALQTQTNLSAYYLIPGDYIQAHVAKKVEKTLYLDYITRIKK